MSNYTLQAPQADDAVLQALHDRGVHHFDVDAPLGVGMNRCSLDIAVQVGLEVLGRWAGARDGDVLTADIANRGLLAYIQDRERGQVT